MANVTLEGLYNQIESLKKVMAGVSDRTSALETISGIYITQASLQTSMRDMNDKLNSMNSSINDIEVKLQKISLPDNTRYYLEESEIVDFRTNFKQLRVMMTELEKSRQAMIRLMSRYNLSNSTL